MDETTKFVPVAGWLCALGGVVGMASGVGLILAGRAAARSDRWRGRPRYVPLACGVAVFVLVLPGLFGSFLAGRLVLTAWMALFTALGLALITTTTPATRLTTSKASKEGSLT